MRSRLLKSLRIAVTAVLLLVCGLLLVLWVRSYYHYEMLSILLDRSQYSKLLSLASYDGISFLAYWQRETPGLPTQTERWILSSIDNPYHPSLFGYGKDTWYLRHYADYYTSQLRVSAPYWFFITIFATIAALPWFKWRFSLRTLLIVMTLFALFFGAIAMSL